MEQVPVEQLRAGDVIDITPLLDDPDSLPWDWNGMYDIDLEAARRAAAVEHAHVNGPAKPSTSHAGRVEFGTTQMNFTLPSGYTITRISAPPNSAVPLHNRGRSHGR
ncbi:hypothetical protein [Mycolicibacter senuensis]|uniref:Uncharacterized protein n=2 Tax=Mycolicibacter longobardus TaxID=1108812 RepID=A0A1X1YBI2_9MYCO|nr:hypothetical protein [Mycolicibacter senuensis]ORW08457.1 hypothetical protein AWC16_18830 [Mycolicibacter longobardus]RAV04432.1 hypothetical protein DQP56_01035 [Mycolicibacter senuensis]